MPLSFRVRPVVFLVGIGGAIACERKDVSSLVVLTVPRWHLSDCIFCPNEPRLPGSYNPVLDKEPCVRDDFTTFKVDGTYVDDEGALRCDPHLPQARCFTWHFSAKGRELAMRYAAPGQTQEVERHYKIITLTPTKLVLEGWAPAYSCKCILTYTAF
ncbi:hypothetical protein ACVWYF_003607 [Hymenobacter sp. UYAg731]